MATTIDSLPPDRRPLLLALHAEYRTAQAEEDKGFMAQNADLETQAHGKIAGLLKAVQIVADLEDVSHAVALLDDLDQEQ